MFRSLYTAATGMSAQNLNLDAIANNIANASTNGFRGTRLQFQDLLYQTMIAPGSAQTAQTTVPDGLQIGLGTRTASSEVLETQGDLSNTGNPLDLAIQGQGFFQIQLASGQIAYTRAGNFHLNENRSLVTAEGDPLQPTITVPADALTINIGSDGTVSVTEPNQTQAAQVGNIQLALFPNPGGLAALGNNYFIPTTSSGQAVVGTPGGADGLGTLQQGMLEQSNVDITDQFIQMILAQRTYESDSRVVDAADQMFQTLNNLGR
jgi:flagellar basal-body rod protein FlgG